MCLLGIYDFFEAAYYGDGSMDLCVWLLAAIRAVNSLSAFIYLVSRAVALFEQGSATLLRQLTRAFRTKSGQHGNRAIAVHKATKFLLKNRTLFILLQGLLAEGDPVNGVSMAGQ